MPKPQMSALVNGWHRPGARKRMNILKNQSIFIGAKILHRREVRQIKKNGMEGKVKIAHKWHRVWRNSVDGSKWTTFRSA